MSSSLAFRGCSAHYYVLPCHLSSRQALWSTVVQHISSYSLPASTSPCPPSFCASFRVLWELHFQRSWHPLATIHFEPCISDICPLGSFSIKPASALFILIPSDTSVTTSATQPSSESQAWRKSRCQHIFGSFGARSSFARKSRVQLTHRRVRRSQNGSSTCATSLCAWDSRARNTEHS